MNIEDIRKVKLSDGDVLVIRTPFKIRLETAEQLKGHVKKIFPDHPCIILDDGTTLDVLTRHDIEALGE